MIKYKQNIRIYLKQVIQIIQIVVLVQALSNDYMDKVRN